MFPMEKPAVRLLRIFVLFLVIGCFSGKGKPLQIGSAPGKSIEHRVQTIHAEAKRIDAASDAPKRAKRHHLSVNLPHWQFSGRFENSTPIFLNALFTEGQVVREESYYLFRGKPLLVKVEKWWDVDEEIRAPEPATHQEFYIENDRTIRRVIKVESSPATRRTLDKIRPATAFAKRSRLIAKILLENSPDAKITDPLQQFPEAELPQE